MPQPATPVAPLHAWDAVDLAHGIRTGLISSREAVQACLDRIAAVNPEINAVVDVLAESALAQAQAADRAVAAGEALGPLHGVPVTIKVNVDLAGRPTTNGVVAWRDLIAPADSPVVANLRRAGAIPVGRTNTPGFSFRWFTENDLHGRTLNPWSRGHTPGGSSGGASAALAAGIGAIAHGNDIGGSIRYPAYCTGTFGLRPSFGRVPAFNPSASAERPLSAQLMSVQGPLTRSVRDLRVALAAMASADLRDPWWVPAPLAGEPVARPIRVALSFDAAGTPASPPVRDALRRAADALAAAGYAVEERDPPGMAQAADLWNRFVHGEARHLMAPAVTAHGDAGIRQAFAWMLDQAPELSALELMQAGAGRAALLRSMMGFLAEYPLALYPVSAELPFEQGLDTRSRADFERIFRAQAPLFPAATLGLPALSAPVGMAQGLPVGVQLMASRFREDLLLDAAEVLEARFPGAGPIDPRA
ncbi:MAG: amidase [Betaproteobacteria bacterium]|nr:amidase [Betaproteobacteria bacterium]